MWEERGRCSMCQESQKVQSEEKRREEGETGYTMLVGAGRLPLASQRGTNRDHHRQGVRYFTTAVQGAAELRFLMNLRQ